MEAWNFTEMPYPDLPPEQAMNAMWVTPPSAMFDPPKGADLYHRYLDEYLLADDLGLNIMLNEHHQTPSCLNSAVPLMASILARQSKNARILVLGNPVANRGEPVRIAEEMAIVDCLSRGRLECGFVRGVPYENFASNSNPSLTGDRLWEGIALAVKTWTTHDGPFSYEGRFWHARSVNIWPRPYQTPHPPIWITGSSDHASIRKAASLGYVFATFLQPHDSVRKMFDAYRENYVDTGLPGGGGIAYMPLVYVGDTEEEAEKGARELLWYMQVASEPQFRNPPGYVPVAVNVQALKGAYSHRTAAIRKLPPSELRELGVLMYGTPDAVAQQIKTFYERVGGFDHLLMMQQAGHLDHARTVKNMTLFAREVYPQVKDLPRTQPAQTRVAAE